VAEFGEDLKVASRASAKIEYSERPFTLDVLQDRCDVLADVVVASAFPEILGMPVIEIQGHVGDFVRSCECNLMFDGPVRFSLSQWKCGCLLATLVDFIHRHDHHLWTLPRT
jgi:hypothetical protein